MSRSTKPSAPKRPPKGVRSPDSFRLRRATAKDIELLVRHRHQMWSALGGRTEEEIHEHDPTYRRWALNLIRGGKLFAVIAESPRTGPVASGCLWLQPEQPRPVMMVLESPYILSMFTEPEYRGHGLASRIVETLIEIARKKGFSRVVLHAAKEDARRIYSRIGFEPSSEMRYFMDKSMRRDGWNATEPAAGRKKH